MAKSNFVFPKSDVIYVQEEFKPSFYDKAYFEGGIKSNYEGYQHTELIFVFLSRIIAKIFRPRSILDIGCAYGYLIKHLRLGIQVGIDISPYAIAECRSTNKLLSASASHLPFKRNTFDTVVCLETLEHLTIPQITQCFSEVDRVGKKWFYFTTPPPDSEDKDKDSTHINLFWPEEWEKLIKDQFFHWIPQPDLVKIMNRESLVGFYNWKVFIYDISNNNI